MQKILLKMQQNQYESIEDMTADFVQMFDNACKYNEPDSLIYKVRIKYNEPDLLIYKVHIKINTMSLTRSFTRYMLNTMSLLAHLQGTY